MLFKPELARLILAGKKTQTRRVVRGDCYYRVGRSYPLERIARRDEMSPVEQARMDRPDPRRRGRPPRIAIAMLNVVSVEQQRLAEISFEDARAEGFRTPADFRRYWLTIHDRAWPAIEQVPCPACLADPEMPSDELPTCATCGGEQWLPFRPWPTDDEVSERFNLRHGNLQAWVITFAVSQAHEPRLLAARSEIGYVAAEFAAGRIRTRPGTTTLITRRVALVSEPEALSDAEHERHVAKGAREREIRRKEQQRRDRELLDLEQRMRDARATARLKHMDIRSELRLFREHREQGREAAAVRAIEAVERLVLPQAA